MQNREKCSRLESRSGRKSNGKREQGIRQSFDSTKGEHKLTIINVFELLLKSALATLTRLINQLGQQVISSKLAQKNTTKLSTIYRIWTFHNVLRGNYQPKTKQIVQSCIHKLRVIQHSKLTKRITIACVTRLLHECIRFSFWARIYSGIYPLTLSQSQ